MNKIIATTILTFFSIFWGWCNVNEKYLFTKISLEQGLSHSTVLDIAQDSLGYMWFATQDGLNRYNGYEVKVFYYDAADTLSINSTYLRSLCVDDKNRIWVGGENGVSYFDYDIDGFKNYKLFQPQQRDFISSIVNDEKGRIWLSSLSGKLYLYNRENDSFDKLIFKNNTYTIQSIEEIVDADNYLFLCTSNGLFQFNKENRTLTPVFINGELLPVHDVTIGKDGSIWVGTANHGLFLLNQHYQVTAHFYNEPNNPGNSILHNKIRALGIDKSGLIWIGTFKGLSVLNPYSRTIDNYTSENEKNISISHNSIRSIFKDKDNGIWLGTFYGGVSYYHEGNVKFKTIDKYSGQLSLNDNVINCLQQGKDGRVWIGSNDNGLSCWDMKQNKIIPSSFKITSSLKVMLPLEDGSLLIGTHWGGLINFSPQRNSSKTYKVDNTPHSISDNRVDALLKDHLGNIWVGTYNGLLRFDIPTGKFTPLKVDSRGNKLSSSEILSLFEDSHQRIWIGTFSGLNIYYPDTDILETFQSNPSSAQSLSKNEVTTIFEDSKKRIWIGTSNGLNLFDEVTRTFKRYTTNNGLSNNFICAIQEDNESNLWLSSNGGLMKFDPTHEIWEYFEKSDGLQSNQFNHASVCKLSDGRMMFGGINGITLFNPDKIKTISTHDKILFTELLVNNKTVRPNDENDILAKHISKTEKIELSYDQRLFTIKYSTINFNINNNTAYLYKLEGYMENWVPTKNRELIFSDLPVGTYYLHVKADISNHESDNPESILEIEILPPWWRSVPMYIFYFIALAFIIVLAYRIALDRFKLHSELNIEKLKKQKMEEVQEMQMQFFINISHEFKTPLTLIISPLEKLKDSYKNDEWQNHQIETVHKNALSLLSLIEQLINFQKIENGQTQLHVSKKNIIEALSNIYSSFYPLAKGKNMNYVFNSNPKELNIMFDSYVLERICYNLLSNAFKFTPAGGDITFDIATTNDYLTITVEDSGKGIPKEQLDLIFKRFYSVIDDKVVGGTGIGLTYAKLLAELHHGYIQVKSELGKGAAFTLYLPLSSDVYSSSEIFMSDEYTNTAKYPLSINIPNERKEIQNNTPATEKTATILVIDDNLNMTNYLYENLSFEYNIDVAHDGQEALEKINSNEKEYDLLICDVMMPKMNGIILCKKIRQNLNTCHIPIIMLSAKSDIEHAIKGLESGADDYIAKPLSIKLLELKIHNIINMRKRLKEIYKNSINVEPSKIAYFSMDQEFLSKAVECVEKHLSEPEFSVETFAEMMCMSRSTLHLKFKAITGDSISDFIKKIRFRKAIELLESKKYNIAEISIMTGFSTPSYFSKVFKKNFGYLPTEYRKINEPNS